MDNRLFSLVIVPDSGNDVKSGSFNFKLVLSFLGVLSVTFLICVLLIVGYHVKLFQEKEFSHAISMRQELLDSIEKSQRLFTILSDKLLEIQRNDVAYRQYAYMDVLDDDMYKAGIGGHVIVDESAFTGLKNDLQAELSEISLDLINLTSRVTVQNNSFVEIYGKVQENNEEYDCTPSILPTHSYRITSSYGYRTHPVTGIRHFHSGVDLAGSRGNYIYATANGVVIQTIGNGTLGRCIKIKHKYNYETLYGHLDRIMVKVGQEVKKGEIIGTMGSSGRVTGVHTHYAVSHLKKSVNPYNYF